MQLVASRPSILGVAVHAIDKFAGIPLWKYSLSFAYLKAYLSKWPEYDQVAFDTVDFYQNEAVESIAAEVKARRPAMVLFSVYVWNYQVYRALAGCIKRDLPEVLIVLGGPEVSDDSDEFLRDNPGFDIVVTGEGEHVFYEIVQRWLRSASMADVRGLTWRAANGEVTINPAPDPSILSDINAIPSPLRHGILDVNRIRGSFAALETQRGCNFSCGFCRYRKVGEGARFFQIERVFEDIDFLKQAGIKHLYIMDPTFNNNVERAKKILRRIIDADMGLTINAEMVPEFFDEEMLVLALQAGIVNVEVGVQSINANALKVMQRPRSARKLDARILMAAGIRFGDKKFNVIPQIIYGLPGEGFADYLLSFDYIYAVDVAEIAMYHLLVLRDTQFYRDRERHGFVYDTEPPHRLISSHDWSADELVLAGKLSTAAVSTQYSLRGLVLAYCARHGVTPSAFFLERVKVGELAARMAVAFPIYGHEDAGLCRALVDRMGAVLVEDDDSLALRQILRQTKMMFTVRAGLVESKTVQPATMAD